MAKTAMASIGSQVQPTEKLFLFRKRIAPRVKPAGGTSSTPSDVSVILHWRLGINGQTPSASSV